MKAILPEIFEFFSAISFIIYGILSFRSNIMKSEFKRWGISKFRFIVGCAQLTGGFGLLIGYYFPIMTLISSFGLALLMTESMERHSGLRKAHIPHLQYTTRLSPEAWGVW